MRNISTAIRPTTSRCEAIPCGQFRRSRGDGLAHAGRSYRQVEYPVYVDILAAQKRTGVAVGESRAQITDSSFSNGNELFKDQLARSS